MSTTERLTPDRARGGQARGALLGSVVIGSPAALTNAISIARITRYLARITRYLVGADVAGVAERSVQCAINLMPGVDRATVVATSRGRSTTLADSGPHTTPVAGRPAVAKQQLVLHLPDLPAYRRPGRDGDPSGVTAVDGATVSYQLVPSPSAVSWSLNLHRVAAPGLSSDRDVDPGEVLAVHVAAALFCAHRIEHLTQAVAGRDIIGQAKGILMERFRIDADRAFKTLTRLSQTGNRKLHLVAQQLVLTGELPRDRPADDGGDSLPDPSLYP